MSQQFTTTMVFQTIEEFKAQTGAIKIDIVKNPNTGKIFASAAGKNYKVEQAIDLKEPIRFMSEENGDFNEGCFVNVTESENLIGTI